MPGSRTLVDLIFLYRWLPSDLPPLSALSLGRAVGGKPTAIGVVVGRVTETGRLSGTSSAGLTLSLHFTGGV